MHAEGIADTDEKELGFAQEKREVTELICHRSHSSCLRFLSFLL